jgi:NAD(P)-dependent dehydrogenase (short-subunit alcohol dehydrogenase family)
MTTIAIIGAGPGLGAAVARRFGAEGFDVALVVPGAITPGHPTHDPDVLAERLWQMHTSRGEFRVFAEPLP